MLETLSKFFNSNYGKPEEHLVILESYNGRQKDLLVNHSKRYLKRSLHLENIAFLKLLKVC